MTHSTYRRGAVSTCLAVIAVAVAVACAAEAAVAATPDQAMKQLTARAHSGFASSTTLPGGRYHMTELASPYRFTLTKPTPAWGLLPWYVDLMIAGTRAAPAIEVAFWSGSLDFLETRVKQASLSAAQATSDVPRTPAGMLAWLRANPRLTLSGRRSVTIGGARGIEIAIRAKKGAAYETDLCGGAKCAPLFVTPPLTRSRNHGDWIHESADAGNPVRVEMLSVHGKLLLITTDIYSGNFEQQTRLARQVLSTVTFD